jgi:hypothetical protein
MAQPTTDLRSIFRRIPRTVIAPAVVGFVGILIYFAASPARVPGELRSPLIVMLFAGLAGGIVGRGPVGYLALIGGGLAGFFVGALLSLASLGWDLRGFVLGTIFFALTILLFYTPGWAIAATFRQAVRTTRGTSRPPRFLPSAAVRSAREDDHPAAPPRG